MAENITRGRGRSQPYKFDRGGVPAETGPYIGEIRNNIDPIRMGRVSVYIEEFAGPNKDDETLWRTVSYLPPFYGATEHSGTSSGPGNYVGNRHSYGMWFTPPDIGTRVLCFFPGGRHNDGYYVGCIPEPGLNHMVPAIGGTQKYITTNSAQESFFRVASRLPVTELNDEDRSILQDPRFFEKPKPVHAVFAGQLNEQGLLNDRVRGSIGSAGQRETPSSVYGISTPGRPIYESGVSESEIRQKLEQGEIKPTDVKVVGRRGGHSLVMDDGDLDGKDQLVRIRTAKGHQITMSDSGDCFYIVHANGHSWIEFGKEGTVDVYSTNSINLRTQGELNFHADTAINMYSGGTFNVVAKETARIETDGFLSLVGEKSASLASDRFVGIRSDGVLAVKSNVGSWDAGAALSLKGGIIGLNSGATSPVTPPPKIPRIFLPDSEYDPSEGWKISSNSLETTVTRAPSHEPWIGHNRGVESAKSDSITGLPFSPSNQIARVLETVRSINIGDGISVGDWLNQDSATVSIGTIQPDEVTGMLAQLANTSGQSSLDLSAAGAGKYAHSVEQLEKVGLIKPGTASLYVGKIPTDQILRNPQVWTGRDGVTNVTQYLSNDTIQNTVQEQLLVDGYVDLQLKGIITGFEPPEALAPLIQNASVYGADTVEKWVSGTDLSSIPADAMNQLGKGATYAVDLVKDKVSGTVNTARDFAGKLTSGSFGDLRDSALSNINVQGLLQAGINRLAGGLFGGTGPIFPSPRPGFTTEEIVQVTQESAKSIIGNAKVPPFITPDDGV